MMSIKTEQLDRQLEGNIEQQGPREEIILKFKQDYVGIAGLIGLTAVIAAAVFGPMLTPYDPLTPDYNALHLAPSMEHPMGTDHLGRDTMSRVLLGARYSLMIGFFSILFATFWGVLIGGTAGYTSKEWLDETLMRSMDVMLAFPAILLGIALVGIVGGEGFSFGFLSVTNLHIMILIIGLVYTPRFARVTRGAVLKEASQSYVKMSRLEGASHRYIFTREIFINILPPILVLFTYRTGSAMIVAAGFGFLGIGVTPPTPGWGVMLANGKEYIASGSWWMVIFPGLALATTIMALNLFGDAVRDALDPNVSTLEEA